MNSSYPEWKKRIDREQRRKVYRNIKDLMIRSGKDGEDNAAGKLALEVISSVWKISKSKEEFIKTLAIKAREVANK